MSLGVTVPFVVRPPDQGRVVQTGQFVCDWLTISTDVTTSDGNPVLKPGTITRATTQLVNTNGKGTTLLVRLKYDVGVTGVTSPVIQVFGKDNNGIWMNLPDSSPAITSTLTATVGTDVQNDAGTFSYSPPKSFPTLGCNMILVVVKVAFSGTGTYSNATLEAKVY